MFSPVVKVLLEQSVQALSYQGYIIWAPQADVDGV